MKVRQPASNARPYKIVPPVDPDAADALILLAQEARDPRSRLQLWREAVAAGERSLGPGFPEEGVGPFRDEWETRPYMRARAGLARCLWDLGARDAAIGHYRDLIGLYPDDNQGIRYLLLGCLLAEQRDDEVGTLLKLYPDDPAATWAYGRALLAFKRGDADAGRLLASAIGVNPFVPNYLLGRMRMPDSLPRTTGWGDETEAITCVHEQLEAWLATTGALEWLRSPPVDFVDPSSDSVRHAGVGQRQVWMSDDFDAPTPEIEKYFR